jgi:hypothetical protein
MVRRRVLAAAKCAAATNSPSACVCYMTRAKLHVILPNPHGRDISAAFLSRILRQAGLSREEWEVL